MLILSTKWSLFCIYWRSDPCFVFHFHILSDLSHARFSHFWSFCWGCMLDLCLQIQFFHTLVLVWLDLIWLGMSALHGRGLRLLYNRATHLKVCHSLSWVSTFKSGGLIHSLNPHLFCCECYSHHTAQQVKDGDGRWAVCRGAVRAWCLRIFI